MSGQFPRQEMQLSGGAASQAAGGWLLLSDSPAAPVARLPQRLTAGLLMIELAWPLPSDVLLAWQDDQGRALSLFHDGGKGLVLLWREGARLTRHALPGRLRAEGQLARLFLSWNRNQDFWSLRLDDGVEETIASVCGQGVTGLPGDALMQIFGGRGLLRRDPAVLWFGLTAGESPPPRLPWIGRSTPVPTPGGPVAAGLLRAGDWILTRDAGPVRLRSIRHLQMPSRGSHAAVILRAPYYALSRDLLVSADQMIAIGGPEAEYLFDEDEVLVAAGALVDGRSAITDNRRSTTACVSLDLGRPCLIETAGCVMLTGHHGGHASRPILPLRALQEYEARPLMELLRRMRPSDAA